jgi:hypothetical protein
MARNGSIFNETRPVAEALFAAIPAEQTSMLLSKVPLVEQIANVSEPRPELKSCEKAAPFDNWSNPLPMLIYDFGCKFRSLILAQFENFSTDQSDSTVCSNSLFCLITLFFSFCSHSRYTDIDKPHSCMTDSIELMENRDVK